MKPVLNAMSPNPTSEDNENQPDNQTQGSNDKEAQLSPGESFASDQEMQLLYQTMTTINKTLIGGFNHYIQIMKESPNLAKTIGDTTFLLCGQIFMKAARSGTQIPMDIFMMQGGAVFQTIDALGDMAEAAKLNVDDDVRKNALGYAMQDYLHSRIDQGNIDPSEFMPHIQDMETRAGIKTPKVNMGSMQGAPQQGGPPQGGTPAMMPMNKMAGAVQQGLLGGMQNG